MSGVEGVSIVFSARHRDLEVCKSWGDVTLHLLYGANNALQSAFVPGSDSSVPGDDRGDGWT